MAETIAENISKVWERIRNAARKAGREPGEVTLICATKTIEVKRIKEAVAGGARVFGENYVQEAAEKIGKIKDASVSWHLIGHLQKNKVKHAVELFDVIHTVDSENLASLINRRTQKPIDVLIEINIGGEQTKAGITPREAVNLARAISKMEKLRLRGLMAIPPETETPEGVRPYFITLRRLAERINREKIPGVSMRDLSIGMSSDFDVAIEEGATMVRIGSAIFGAREAPPVKKAAAKAAKKTERKAEKKTQKKPIKKAAEKKPAPRKAAPKKTTARKTAAKKTTAAKTPAKKAEKRTVKKAAEKKPAPRKAAPKKTTARKTTAKKTTAAKTVAKKAEKRTVKKAAEKKSAPRKAAPKKTTARKTAAKKTTAAKTVARKAEKRTVKKTAKKTSTKKTEKK